LAVKQARDFIAGLLANGLPTEDSVKRAEAKGAARDEDAWEDKGKGRAWTAFCAFRRGFNRSAKGNLTRQFGWAWLTIFEKRGGFHWCMADGETRRYSRGWEGWVDEASALRALWEPVQEMALV
jgi:hypothetical protein